MRSRFFVPFARYFGLGVAALLLAGYSASSTHAASCKKDVACNAINSSGLCTGSADGAGNCLCEGYLFQEITPDPANCNGGC